MTIQNELSITYSPNEIEKKWYQLWEQGKYFAPKKGKQSESFCIIVPPPNVTGILHAGHALDITTQDALIRYKRMKGFETLYLPGMDHAGIATQSKVEEKIWKEEGKTRSDFQRDEFLEKVWQWKEDHGGQIAHQQRVMGASSDWDYFLFTMDPEANEAVKRCFVTLYNEGLIYQSDYIINWDPILQSAISDAEVEHKEIHGAFYYINYQIEGEDHFLEVATTRPETLLADSAVAVNPKDERFKHLIGKNAIVPICNRVIPIIGDEYVSIEKGTGSLKVTPGHDFNDFEIGRRHSLKIIKLLNKDGTLNEHGLEWQGLSCKKARPLIINRLKDLGQFVKEEKHTHQVGHGDRSGAVIEPMVSKQWFLSMGEMAKVACENVDNGNTQFVPKSWENTYFSWLRNPKDWCISRQLWWGHRIPVFSCNDCSHQWASEDIKPEKCPSCGLNHYEQDPDVLDTWFSSGIWPLTTLGWPDPERMKAKKFSTFYPTSVLVTGFDIIFFWVARMMMMCQKMENTIPFSKVYIHAIVRDKLGRKMSKSIGNGIDPIEMANLYGADAFRFTLAAGSGYNRNINLDPDRISGYRSFINKIWNAFRFISPFLESASDSLPTNLDHHERWILAELNETIKGVNESMEEYRFDDSCSSIYSFVYDKFCSWFIELSKNILHGDDKSRASQRASVLKFSFRNIVSLLHPFTPFITEELWGHLKRKDEDLLIASEFPEFNPNLIFNTDREQMNHFVEVVTSIRNLRQSVNLSPKEKVKAVLFCDNPLLSEYFKAHTRYFSDLCRSFNTLVFSKSEKRPSKSIMAATTHTEIFIPLEGVIDIQEQIGRLDKELIKAQSEYQKYLKKLQNKKFMDNAPENIRLEVQDKVKALQEKLNSIQINLDNFKGD